MIFENVRGQVVQPRVLQAADRPRSDVSTQHLMPIPEPAERVAPCPDNQSVLLLYFAIFFIRLRIALRFFFLLVVADDALEGTG
jgi:hypothetical protein